MFPLSFKDHPKIWNITDLEHIDKMQRSRSALNKTQGYCFIQYKIGFRKNARKKRDVNCKQAGLSDVIT
jgi:hypothetical protein